MFDKKQIWAITYCNTSAYASVAILNNYHDYQYVHTIITNYNKDTNYLSDINDGDLVYIINFSLPLNIMQSLNERCDLVWIDHHEKVINDAKKIKFNPKGIRSVDRSSSLLTWEYCYNNKPIPEVFKLVDDYERFAFKLEDTLPFYYGSSNIDLRPYKNNYDKWISLMNIHKIDGEYKADNTGQYKYFQSILNRGRELVSFYDMFNDICCMDLAYTAEYKGYRLLLLNAKTGNSFIFNNISDEIKKTVDAMVTYTWFENIKKWRLSFYTPTTHNSNVLPIAKLFNGGGSPNVAGAAVSKLPKEFFNNAPIEVINELDKYVRLYAYLKTAPAANWAMMNGIKISFSSQGIFKVFENNSALMINSPHFIPEMFHQTDTTEYTLGISYVYINRYKWRLIIRKLSSAVDLEPIKQKYNGQYTENDGLAIYLSTEEFLPILYS